MINHKDDTFLARWLNGHLTDQELAEFKNDPEYPFYEKIIKGTEAIQPAEFDEESLLEKIISGKEEIKEQSNTRLLWSYGLAAAIALLIGFYIIFSLETTKSTGYGTQLAFNLPDQSEVILNANSEASFASRNWEDNREVSLMGEAFFKVQKGSTFTVKTSTGDVSVLGTQFNVKVSGKLFEVTCYEGKVSVTTSTEPVQILLPGKSYREIDGKQSLLEGLDANEPAWISGRSSFRSIPIQYVFADLQNQYQITIEGDIENYNQLFSGSFPHDDLEVALQIVLGSLQIDYTIKGNKVILESNS